MINLCKLILDSHEKLGFLAIGRIEFGRHNRLLKKKTKHACKRQESCLRTKTRWIMLPLFY